MSRIFSAPLATLAHATSCTIELLTGSADGYKAIPLTGLEQELYDAIEAKVAAEAEAADDMDVGAFTFDWQFVQKIMSDNPKLVGKNLARKSDRSLASEATVRRRLSELCQKSVIKKVATNQYVISGAARS